ncbi:Ig-like domain-containing protein [Sulfurimonas sp.]|uniref:Ig-like domain-containing protein n=1 Tax=Sulfurimonas sp. TaxID=2022749 RepID=UPI0019D8A9AB|nr:Ig-like domain-containing protein [Sulfurimonas sp.]MBE0514485.1 Ig-like domain-containing protein [Sulfurimonas sp.]
MFKDARKKIIVWFVPILVSMFVIGCGSEDPILGQSVSETSLVPTVVAPKVIAVTPLNNESNVSYNLKHITAEFSVAMDNTTITDTSFTLLDGNSTVTGTVDYANRVADLTLDANLSQDTLYTATITTAAKDTNGVALANDYVWTFTTGSSADETPPTVLSTSPRNGATGVLSTKIVTATFSEPMKALSVTAAGVFTLIETNSTNSVDGNVSYSVINKIASFKPTSVLAPDTNYTANIKNTVTDLAGNTMLLDYNWTFVTADANVTVELVDFGLAAPFGIASTAGVTNTGTAPNTVIDGDAVLNPTATCNGVQILFTDGPGFGLCGGFAPSINGTVVTPLYPDAITAQPVTDDLRAAYLSITPANMPGGTAIAAGTTLGAPIGDPLVEGDNLFYTGVYTSITSILITGDLTLDAQGDPDATFVFQSASTVGTAVGARILLAGGAKASNVYWQAGSDATLQTNTVWNGNILAYRDITMVTGASSCGRLFAGAFTDGLFVFDSNHVSVPGHASAPGTCE